MRRAATVLGLPPVERFEPATHAQAMSPQERQLFADGPAPTVSLWTKKPKRFGASYPGRTRRGEEIVAGHEITDR